LTAGPFSLHIFVVDQTHTQPTPPGRLKRVAEALLAGGQTQAAAKAYAELWERTHDETAGAGLLECLSRLGRHAEALGLADELAARFPDSPECRRQVHGVWYRGRFARPDPDCPYDRLVACAQSLLNARPDPDKAHGIIIALAQAAVRTEQWDKALDWTGRLSQAKLTRDLRALRLDCIAAALLGQGRAAETLAMVRDLPDKFPALRHRFLIHLLRAYLLLDSPYDAAAIYVELSHHHPPPAWVFTEHGRLERSVGHNGDAVVLLSRAMLFTRPLIHATAVLEDLAELMLKLGWYNSARDHLLLNAWLREVHGWPMPERLSDLLAQTLAGCRGSGECVPDKNAALEHCRAIWRHQASRILPVRRDARHTRRVMRERRGLLMQEDGLWLIRTERGTDFPCPPDLVPAGLAAGAAVRFDADPGFDRTRRVETWRTTSVRAASPSDTCQPEIPTDTDGHP
jgi:tetratricopeptide (TPR) repeat protein